MKRFLFYAIMVCTTMLYAITIGPLTNLDYLPPALDFNSETGIQVIDGIVYLVYTGLIEEGGSSSPGIIFAYAFPPAEFEYQVLFTPDNDTYEMGAPSLSVVPPELKVAFGSRIFCSPNMGQSWEHFQMNSNDPYPLLCSSEYGTYSYSVHHDPFQGDYLHFTNNDASVYDTSVYFCSNDDYPGKVRSNSDILLKNYGDWPVFSAPVITSGVVHYTPSVPPVDSVFQGGLFEHAPRLEFDYPALESIYQDAEVIGDSEGESQFYVAVAEGTRLNLMRGRISNITRQTIPGYSEYPPGENHLFTNTIAVWDTMWTDLGSIPLTNRPLLFRDKLWLKGTFSGNVTIACEDSIFLIGDILLQNTPVGTAPDVEPVNDQDHVSLISNRQILIKYGYFDPIDSVNVHPNCGPIEGGIFIYADLITPRINERPLEDGVFTFEYQHPHSSTPTVMFEGQLYSWIDLYRHKYPQYAASPWPQNLDYPWVNPLWPEGSPYLERGSVHLWGSVYQQRRGFLHRSKMNTDINPTGIWDLEQGLYGGTSGEAIEDPILGLSFEAQNFPGAEGQGVGYLKDFHSDTRPLARASKYPIFGLGMRLHRLNEDASETLFRYVPLNEEVRTKSMDRLGDQFLFHLNNQLITFQSEYPQTLPEGWMIKEARLTGPNSTIQLWDSSVPGIKRERLVLADLAQGANQSLCMYETTNSFSTLKRLGNTFLASHLDPTGVIHLKTMENSGSIISNTTWNPELDILSLSDFTSRKGSISFAQATEDSIFALIWVAADDSTGQHLYLAPGNLGYNSLPSEEGIPALINLACYPNPFRENLLIKINSQTPTPAQVSIYNLKGQKIRSFQAQLNRGITSVTWDGRDSQGTLSANGIYFIRIHNGTNSYITKTLKLK
ncbi:MAG: T9SS type A sorting domain-containing protein [Candidatus Cloacimonetes bacterium]|nr:T9SS type A sorting domain-containing protein [Candidatus Cloacimonadota bacterium]